MGSTRLGAPPMGGLPGRVVWIDPPLGRIASSPGLHVSQVAGGSSVAAPLHMDSPTSSCPLSLDVSVCRVPVLREVFFGGEEAKRPH
jgi:hypothetical protein